MAKKKTGYTCGDTITIKKPAHYTASEHIAKISAKMLAESMGFVGLFDPTFDDYKKMKKPAREEFVKKILKDLSDERADRRKFSREVDDLKERVGTLTVIVKTFAEGL